MARTAINNPKTKEKIDNFLSKTLKSVIDSYPNGKIRIKAEFLDEQGDVIIEATNLTSESRNRVIRNFAYTHNPYKIRVYIYNNQDLENTVTSPSLYSANEYQSIQQNGLNGTEDINAIVSKLLAEKEKEKELENLKKDLQLAKETIIAKEKEIADLEENLEKYRKQVRAKEMIGHIAGIANDLGIVKPIVNSLNGLAQILENDEEFDKRKLTETSTEISDVSDVSDVSNAETKADIETWKQIILDHLNELSEREIGYITDLFIYLKGNKLLLEFIYSLIRIVEKCNREQLIKILQTIKTTIQNEQSPINNN